VVAEAIPLVAGNVGRAGKSLKIRLISRIQKSTVHATSVDGFHLFSDF
jgi:hypothetical protein